MESLQDRLLNYFQTNNVIANPLSIKERWKIQQSWRETFAFEVKAKTGKWTYRGNDWHAFSYNFTPCLRGFRAIEAFNLKTLNHLYLVSSNIDIPAYNCIGRKSFTAGQFIDLLSNIPELIDLYLFTEHYEWTMVIVHEPDIGPFFAEK